MGTACALADAQTRAVNLGSVNVASTSAATSVTLTLGAGGTLGSGTPLVLTKGEPNLDFAYVAGGSCAANSTYNAGATCTVDVTFTPRSTGTSYGAVVLRDGSGNVLATGYIYGTGLGPQLVFSPGSQSTVANSAINGLYKPNGVAVDGIGTLYIANTHGTNVIKVTTGGSQTRLADSTPAGGSLILPFGVAVDGAGNVYISDYGYEDGTSGSKALKLSWNGSSYGTPTSVGTGLNQAGGLVVDASGNVFIADSGNNQVLKETLQPDGSYSQSKVVDGQTQVLGLKLSAPTGVAVDVSGNVYIADTHNRRVVKVPWNSTSSTYDTVSASLLSGNMNEPEGVAVDGNGNVFITNLYGPNYTVPGSNGSLWKETLQPDRSYIETVLLDSGLNMPDGVAVDSSGNVYVVDWNNSRVLKVDYADAPTLSFATTNIGSTSSDSPQKVTVENIGNAPLTFPPLSSGNNPSIASGFTLGNTGTCPIVLRSGNPETLAAGATCTLPVSFAPATVGSYGGSQLVLTDDALNVPAPGYAQQVIGLSGIGAKGTPTITWATPAAITYGTALGTTQLNASSGSVAGSFVYSPASGTVLGAGANQTLSVTFNPTDTTNYASTSITTTIEVVQATPTITWPTPAAITYGTTLGSTQLNATASVPGTFVYSPAAGTTPAVGNDTLSVAFTPTDTANYTTATRTVTLTVSDPTNPLPVIGRLSPAYTSARGAAFTLMVNGSNFTGGSTILWAGTALPTTYVSATQLTAQVPASSIAAMGTPSITVQTPTPGGGTSSVLQFEIDSAGSGASTQPTLPAPPVVVTAGNAATYSVTPPATASNVSATCLNLPAGASCSYSATNANLTITTSSTTPKGSYQVTVVFNETFPGAAVVGALPILLLPFVVGGKKLAQRKIWLSVSLGLVMLAAMALNIGCGGGGGTVSPPVTPTTPQNHQMTSSGVVNLTVE
jgi:sugar lactone lactonase YvrE